MMQNTLEPKCIYDLLGESFEIPDYQRGYRWTSDQVTDLLNDIWEFQSSNKSKEEFYCLQPVVVVPLEGGKFSVVDGQQRLTTIRIIIEALRDRFDDDGYPGPFTLDYQTRFASTSFLNDLKNKTEEEASKDRYHKEYYSYALKIRLEKEFGADIEYVESKSIEEVPNIRKVNSTEVDIWYATDEEEYRYFVDFEKEVLFDTQNEVVKYLKEMKIIG